MKLIFILVFLGVFIVPLSSIIPLQQGTVWHIQYLALFGVLFLGISFALWKFNKYLSLFMIFCLFSMIFVSQLKVKAMLYLVQFDMACLAAYVISKFSKKQRRAILWAIVAMVVIQTSWIVVQMCGKDFIFNATYNEKLDSIAGFSGNTNQLALFFATTSPVVWYIAPYLLPLVLFSLFMCKSTIAWIAFVIISLMYSFFRFRKLFFVITIALIVCSAFYFVRFDRSQAFKTRMTVYKTVIEANRTGKIVIQKKKDMQQIVTCNPWFGFGIGNFSRIFPYHKIWFNNFKNGHYIHAHNDYLELLLFELGRIGLGLFVLLFLNFIWQFIRSNKKEVVVYFCCVLAYLICAGAIYVTTVAVSACWLILFYGLYRSSLKNG